MKNQSIEDATPKLEGLSANERIKRLYSAFRKACASRFNRMRIKKFVLKYMKHLHRWERDRFGKNIKTDFGFELDDEELKANAKKIITTNVNANVELVGGMLEAQREKMIQILYRGYLESQSERYLSKQIQSEFRKSRRQAAAIARTESNKMTNRLNDLNAKKVGATKGIWRGTGDNRERKEHRKLEGKVFELDKGIYIKSEGRWLKPGEDINCRCWTEYLIEV